MPRIPSMKLTPVLFVAGAITLASVIGCGSAPAPTEKEVSNAPAADKSPAKAEAKSVAAPKSEEIADWTKYAAEGATIQVPKDWAGAPLDAATLKELEAQLSKGGESEKQLLARIQSEAKSGVQKLVIFNTEAKGKFIDKINLVTEDLPKEMSSSEYAEAAAPGLASTVKAGTKPIVETKTMPAGPVAVISTTVDGGAMGGGTTTVEAVAYAFVKGKKAYVFTCAASAESAEKLKPVFEKIASTITLP